MKPLAIGLLGVTLATAPLSSASAYGLHHHGRGLIGGLFGLAGAVVVGAVTIATAPVAILAHAASGGRRDGYDDRYGGYRGREPAYADNRSYDGSGDRYYGPSNYAPPNSGYYYPRPDNVRPSYSGYGPPRGYRDGWVPQNDPRYAANDAPRGYDAPDDQYGRPREYGPPDAQAYRDRRDYAPRDYQYEPPPDHYGPDE